MYYTVTLNPSLDYIVETDSFSIGETNRTSFEQYLPGGKGLNVSQILSALGVPNRALGIAGGFVGEEILRMAKEKGIDCDFVMLKDGCSRINVKLRTFDGTEINARGPEVTREAVSAFLKKIQALAAGDTLILSGSVPKGMDDETYRDLLRVLAGRNVRIVVDADGALLSKAIPEKPFLIKPNRREIESLFGVSLKDADAVVPYARKLQEAGALNVLVSMGGDGALLIDGNGAVHKRAVPEGKLVNAVGSGDSMVAGFMAGLDRTRDYECAFRYAVAAGSASAFSENLATGAEIEALYGGMRS